MAATPLVELLTKRLSRFESKADFARAAGLAEGQVHRLFSGEKPGILVTLKVARCLGENPVQLLRLADSHEAADLLSHFVTESERPAALSSTRARVLAHRVIKLVERGLGPRLEDAIRKMTSAVANRLSIRDRGQLREGFFADLAIFDPKTVADQATFERPHQLSVGMRYVLVNGTVVVQEGRHTGAKPGMIVRGPGWEENE